MDDPLLGLLRGNGENLAREDFYLDDSYLYEENWENPDWENSAQAGEQGFLPGNENPERARTLVALGQQLYNALFQGSVGDRLNRAQAIAHNQDSVLRLRLGLKDALLPRLPWEVLHEETRPIATGFDVVFSRYQPTLAPVSLPSQPNGPLKILMVLAAPADREHLALREEAQRLSEELERRSPVNSATESSPEIELEILDRPDRETLTQALEQNHYQVLHYAGHSDLGASGGELYLVNQKTGLSEVLTGDDLAGLLVNNGIRLAVFNSCKGAYTATSDLTDALSRRNLAEVLVKRGVPGVLAMAERIPDEVALTLTRLFYYNLKQGYPVDMSLNRARQGLISSYSSNQLYWALPVLYLHQEFDGYLIAPQGQISQTATPIARRTKINSANPPYEKAYGQYEQMEGDAPRLPHNFSRMGAMVAPTEEELDEDLDWLDDEEYENQAYENPAYDDRRYENTAYNDLDLDDDDAAALVSDIFRTLPLSDRSPRQQEQQEQDWEEDDAAALVSDIFRTLPLSDRSPRQQEQQEQDWEEDDAAALVGDIFRTLPKGDAGASQTPMGAAAMPKSPAQYRKPSQDKGNGRVTAGERPTAIASQAKSEQLDAKRLLKERNTRGSQSLQPQSLKVWLSGAVGIMAIAILGMGLWNWQGSRNKGYLTSEPLKTATEFTMEEFKSIPGFPKDLGTQPNKKVAAFATEQFSQGRHKAGVQAVKLLLYRNDLGSALTVLDRASQEQKSELSFQKIYRQVQSKYLEELRKIATGELTAIAIQNFAGERHSAGFMAVTALLDRGALPQARGALQTIPNNRRDRPDINFLYGRLAWQFARTGNKDYSVDDARRFWEAAVNKAQPKSPLYHNALGFAYYAEGNLARAKHMWLEVVALLEATEFQDSPDSLAAYAGLALVLKQSAEDKPAAEQRMLLSKAIKNRKWVMATNAVYFEPNTLGQNWMWPTSAISDWQKLIEME
ncbi:MAG: CHAT domain-containing protein [Oscillatoria sp. SIO1A7]|nr:CHAT domain-containing protein [Oscillatoria sp. SIO1A7]